MANVYGSFNSTTFNALEVDGGYNVVTENPAEDIADIEQNVGLGSATQNVCSIRQDVQYQTIIAAHNCVSISQNVKNLIAANNICTISQNVIDLADMPMFFERNEYIPQLTIAGRIIPEEMIFGDIQITFEENQNNQATMGLLVQDPVAFIDAVWGQQITIDYVTATSSVRMFTGVVAIPEIDLINRNVKLTCSNSRDELINNTLAYKLPTVGRYSYDVQGEVVDTASEMRLRLQTITKSLDFDGYNTPSFNSWFAKSSPDYTINADEIYYRQPKVVWQDRTKVKNYSTVNITYQYTRLYHYERPFSWVFPYEFCEFLRYQYSLPNVKMVEDAITQAGWKTPSPIEFTSVFPPGVCVFGAFVVAWNTTTFGNQGTYSEKFDALGNIISDPNGNNIYGFTPFSKQTDLSTIYTIGAEWSGAIRFSQYVIENYNLTIQSSQSVSQFGQVKTNAKTALKDDYDASTWEAFATITPRPANANTCGTNCYYFNQDTNPGAMTNAILTSIDEAKASIYSTHRNTFVIAETPIKPYLNLSHTIQMSSDLITAKGKIQKLVHTIAIAEGRQSSTEITLALFRSKGDATETPTYAPTRPADSVDIPDEAIQLGNHYGVTNEAYTGYIGNKFNDSVGNPLALVGTRTDVEEQFRVDTPGVLDAYRKSKQLAATPTTFDIDIPNDLLDVILP